MFTHPHTHTHTTTTVDSLFQQQIIPSVAMLRDKIHTSPWLIAWLTWCLLWWFGRVKLPQVLSAPPGRQTALLMRRLHVCVGRKVQQWHLFKSFFSRRKERSNWTHVSLSPHVSVCISSVRELGNFESSDAGSQVRGSAFTLAWVRTATEQIALELCIWAGEGQIINSVYNIS